ncbi:hypothetical protein PENSPDRAFT_686778 [Peniophora sp. CONT]|nr:hypothetical protein PENSPDRAFT_686778 [Peniophora sp. CONT]
MSNQGYYGNQQQQQYPPQGGYYPQQPPQSYGGGYGGQPGYAPQPPPQTVYVPHSSKVVAAVVLDAAPVSPALVCAVARKRSAATVYSKRALPSSRGVQFSLVVLAVDANSYDAT